ncbi:phospho-acceptor domain-containing protein [Roseimicrobium gellanilyticum]|uniref:histidine kinase n=1 Tax=Roseimicrobium gellanilyticum TaxID=748857 RepID=A0A366H7W3_9BACT|nr:ATP-binding protein [Roseimicrobium gellanilyticum]RBP38135.1 phospho-acceptor domain-containing protein [Roseimicrobium gellanilyticum]
MLPVARPCIDRWYHSLLWQLCCVITLAGLVLTQQVRAQSIPLSLPSQPGSEIIEVAIDGEIFPTLGMPSLSLPPAIRRFAVYMNPGQPRRRKYILEGIDTQWRENTCQMGIRVRFFNDKGEPVEQEIESVIGETQDWNGSLEKPVFVPRKATVTAPPGARSLWLIITSGGGPPDTLGTLLVKGLKITRTRDGGTPEVVMRAPVGNDARFSPVLPAPNGFVADGIRPKMARLLTLAPASGDAQGEQCFALIDDDVGAHAEWRTVKEDALAVIEGDQLEIEWSQAHSVGGGTLSVQDYNNPAPGNYKLRVQPVDLQGLPNGEETTLMISVLPPWWKQRWVWTLTALIVGVLAFALSRYIAHQRLREELNRMKEAALRKAEVEMNRMARATTLGEFTASIAHEISQPLTAMTTNASTCLRWLSPERCDIDEARAAAQRIIGDGDRAVQIIMRIRALLAKDKPIRESSSINAVIEEILPLLTTDIRKRGVKLECDLSADLPEVAIDRVQIQQVVMNLVRNGLDAMNGIADRPRVLRIHTGREAEAVSVQVEDTGVGLSSATIERLFDRFFTTKPEGLGMGLAICQSIVASHGGRLVARPAEGNGAIFLFTLPIE